MERPSWTAIPAARSSLPILTLRLYALLGTLVLAACLGVVSTIAWTTADPPVVDFAAARPLAQAHALSIAESWVSGTATSLPVADGVDARFNEQGDGGMNITVRSLSPFRWVRDTVQGRVVETQYVLVDAVESDLIVAVPFVFDKGTPVLAAYPSLSPAPIVAPTSPLEYQDVPALDSIPAPIRERVAEWGSAYGRNDGAELRDLADDRAATQAQYRGIGGLRLLSTPDIRTAIPTSTGLVLRVRFTYQGEGGGAGLSMDMDMLITAADSFTPRIVAWGPAGTGPSLRPYTNRSL